MTFRTISRDATPCVVSLNFPAHLGGRVRVPGNVTGLVETIGQRQVNNQRQLDGSNRVLLGEDPEMTVTIDAEVIPSSVQLHFLQSLRGGDRTIALGIDRPEIEIDETTGTVELAVGGGATFAGGAAASGGFPGACIQPSSGDAEGKNFEIVKIVDKTDGENKELGLPNDSDLLSDNDVAVFVGMDAGDKITAVAAVAYKLVIAATKVGSLATNGAVTIGDVACRVSQSPSLGSSQRGPDAKVTGQIVLAAQGAYAEEVVNRGT